MADSRDDTCEANIAQPIKAATASPTAAKVNAGFSQTFFCFSAQGSAIPAASNNRRPALTRSASPSSSMSCGRERISRSKSVTPLGGRRPARYRSTIWFLMMNSRSIAGAGAPAAGAWAPGAWFTPEVSIRVAASILVRKSARSTPVGSHGHRCRTGRGVGTPGATQADIGHWSCRIAPAYAAILMSVSHCAASHSTHGFRTILRRGSQFAAGVGPRPSGSRESLVFRPNCTRKLSP